MGWRDGIISQSATDTLRMTTRRIEPHASRLLIIGPSWVGDMVMAQSLFKVLKRRRQETTIDVLAPDWSRPLLQRMPEVSEAISLPTVHGELGISKRYRLAATLRRRGYSEAITLPNSFKSALVPFWARVPRRVGWRGEMRYGLLNDLRVLDKQRFPRMVQRFVALGVANGQRLPTPVPGPELAVQAQQRRTALEKFALSLDRPILALCPGAEFGPAKRWPAEHYGELARRKLADGWKVWIFGSDNDQGPAAQIQASTGSACTDLTGRTSLGEAIDLMSVVSTVVTNDSGLMHVAAALGRPLVALFGSSSDRFTPPMGSKVKTVSLGLACSPCFKRECPLVHLDCLNKLMPERVLAEMDTLD